MFVIFRSILTKSKANKTQTLSSTTSLFLGNNFFKIYFTSSKKSSNLRMDSLQKTKHNSTEIDKLADKVQSLETLSDNIQKVNFCPIFIFKALILFKVEYYLVFIFNFLIFQFLLIFI
jgi:hypothetical protein